ncbi:MAG TPA: TIGR03435 family protein [Bryobacteraceae bacterium]|nr:TIGR03435 family protein [Bryobacteraceae bacterium]
MSLRAILLLAVSSAWAQQTFEVASIKPNAASDNRVMMRVQPGGRFTATGVTLKQLIGQAYNVRDFQISGGPGWIGSERYDINAKAETAAERIPPEQLRPMLRALLEERFQLKVREESREMPVYALVVAKNGPKLTPTSSPQGPVMRMGRGQLDGKKVPVSMLAQQLSQQVGRNVVDKTELKGEYDIVLNWTPEPGQGGGPFAGPPPPDALPPADAAGPTLFTALQEQLGLRLESQKGQVATIVIERAEKPSEN